MRDAELGTLFDLWRDRLAASPDQVFLTCAGRDWTCAEMDELARGVAAGLQARGVRPGERVALQLPNVAEFLPITLGIAFAGAVQVPVNTSHRGLVLEHMLAETAPSWLITWPGGLDRAAEARAAVPSIRGVTVVGETDGRMPAGTGTLDQLLAPASRAEPVAADAATPLSILYTSGTTGPPKGSVLPHGYSAYMARDALRHTRGDAGSVYFTALPLAHIAAQGFVYLPGLLGGGRVVVEESFHASTFWEEVARHGVTHFHWLGAMLSILDRHPGERLDPGRTLVGYGAAMPHAVRDTFESRFGVKLIENYGLSEIGVAAWTPWEGNKPGSFGVASGGYDIRIADAADRELPPGETGEIQLRARTANIMLREYHNRPDATAAAFRNLWFHSGDLGCLDADGFGYFADRAKDAIRVKGNNISSWEVEQALLRHDGVMEAAAIGVPSPLGEEELYVVIVPRPGAALDIAELFGFCAAQMARHSVPRYLDVRTDELPRTETGKVRKQALREAGPGDGAVDREELGISLPRD